MKNLKKVFCAVLAGCLVMSNVAYAENDHSANTAEAPAVIRDGEPEEANLPDAGTEEPKAGEPTADSAEVTAEEESAASEEATTEQEVFTEEAENEAGAETAIPEIPTEAPAAQAETAKAVVPRTAETEIPSVSYQTHIQNIGWEKSWKKNGETSGTTRQSLRLEAIQIKLDGVQYRTHIQNIGWEKSWKESGKMSGTTGDALRLEAIQIKLNDEQAKLYDIYYRVHAQNFGWLGWAKNGESAGTAGYAYRLEAIEIQLVKKGTPAPEPAANAFHQKPTSVRYRTHVQNQGWQPYVADGSTSGTSGKALRLEGINISLANNEASGNILYRTHIQNIGWEKSWKKNGEMSGTTKQSLRLEAIEIKLTDNLAKLYDIYYRVHAQNFGWLHWAKNGESAGTAGYGYRLEAIQIKLVKKGAAAPGKTDVPYTSLAWSKGVNAAEMQIAKSVNVLRYSKGAAPLAWNEKLYQASKIRAKELQTSFSHTRPDQSSCFSVLKDVGYSGYTSGENIAWTSYQLKDAALGQHLYNGWYNSPGHYANMINPDFEDIGVAVYETNGQKYGVQLFGAVW